MLVFLKDDMSYTTIGGLRVYGKKFSYGSFGPTDVPIEIYKEKKNVLSEAEYTKEWLDAKYKCEFPDVSFMLSELYKINIYDLINIAKCVGITYHKGRKITVSEKLALCRAIKKTISQGG